MDRPTVEQSCSRMALWLDLQRQVVESFRRAIADDPVRYGTQPTASQIREDRRKRNGTHRSRRGRNKGVTP